MEDEDKKILENLASRTRVIAEDLEIAVCSIDEQLAIRNLIARNKELEKENYEIRQWKYVIDTYEDLDKLKELDLIKIKGKEYISKDKIREKIEELDFEHLKDRIDIIIEPCSYFYMAIEMAQNKLKELLED